MSVTISGVPIVDLPDLGAVTDSSSVVGEHAGSGRFSAPAFGRYIASGQPWASVKAYGATGNGVTDDTSAINAALASGKTIIFPAGIYNVSGPLTVTAVGQMLWGVGDGITTISTSAAAGDVLTVGGVDLDIGHIGFTASVTRTDGAFINLGNSIQIRVHDFNMRAWNTGILVGTPGTSGGHSIYIERGSLITGIADAGIGIDCICGVVTVLRDLLIEGNNVGGGELICGVHIGAMGDITLDHVETIWAGTGCLIAPPPGAMAQCVFIVNSLFDTGDGYGIRAEASNSASIMLLMINTCWTASNAGGGIVLVTDATGVIQQTSIVNSIFSGHPGGHGLFIGGVRVTNTRCMACSFSANSSSGVFVDANTTYFQLVGNTMGASGQFLGNATGITIANGCNNFTVADNNLNGNTGAAMNLGTLPGTRGVTYWIKDNIAFVTRGWGAMTTTAGPATFTVTHGLSYTPNISEVRLTQHSSLGAAAWFYATNPTGTTFQIVFNTSPGAGVVIGWDVRTLGN